MGGFIYVDVDKDMGTMYMAAVLILMDDGINIDINQIRIAMKIIICIILGYFLKTVLIL
jgi:hypothetical protein